MSFHEKLDHENDVVMGSDKSFGKIFCVIFILLSIYPWIFGDEGISIWYGMVAAFFGISAAYRPEVLAPLNKIWFKFSILLQKFMVPVILGVMFYGMFTPIAFVLRLFGKSLMGIKYSKQNSYWIKRENYNAKEHMPNQF